MDRNRKYVGLIPLGPGQRELVRLKDLLDSIGHYQSEQCAGVIVVDDGNHGPNIAKTVDFSAEVVVIKNPRNGRGWGWEGGTSTGVLAGFRYALEHEVEYVLSLDSDSLVISPFHERIVKAFAQNESVGMVGTVLRPGQNPTAYCPEECGRKLLKALRPVSVWRNPRLHLRSGWSSGNRKVRRYLQLAQKNGYVLGEFCAGGAYATHFKTLRRFKDAGVFDDPFAFLYAGAHDVIFTMLVKAVGLSLLDLSGPGEVFSIDLGGLRDTPPRLAADGYPIIHSVKDHRDWPEDRTRSFFRERRRPLMDHGKWREEENGNWQPEQRQVG